MDGSLRRYEGRYLVGAYHDEEAAYHTTFLDVWCDGDALSAEHLFVKQPKLAGTFPERYPIERRRSERRRLSRASEHTFDVVGRPRRYRFVLGDADVAEGVVVIREGEEARPAPRFVPLPDEVPGRRQQGEWIDLGHPTLCMTAKDTEALVRFYERLGFERGNGSAVRQGWTVIGFLDFQPQPCINYRGASITATGLELARRGYALDGPLQSTHVQGDGAGSLMLYDPDGHRIFFNTHPHERPRYEAWKRGAALPDDGRTNQLHHERDAIEVPVTLPLGQLVVCLDVTDLDASVRFYRGIGFELLDRTERSATLRSRPAREDRYSFPVRLGQADAPSYSFGFFCADVALVSAEIARRGIELIATVDGPAFVDPDGNRVTLFSPLPDGASSASAGP